MCSSLSRSKTLHAEIWRRHNPYDQNWSAASSRHLNISLPRNGCIPSQSLYYLTVCLIRIFCSRRPSFACTVFV
ncbi:hypothetical protein DM02DRAFT_233988 [Periconia macrospinosa]|uniref:Uncharacterized protein n=1 Tax=Periconia macrospinosa TaxID=97972 RepID=A0A2V1EBW8_9PLEO|nr:hypothetical protein DM02DRAFT_233988 [Periconia macrospinosa]